VLLRIVSHCPKLEQNKFAAMASNPHLAEENGANRIEHDQYGNRG
jgi:hypothetical protein